MGNALIMTVRANTDTLLTAGRSESVAGVNTSANNATCSLRLALLLSARLYMVSSHRENMTLVLLHRFIEELQYAGMRVHGSSDEVQTAVDNAKKTAAGF